MQSWTPASSCCCLAAAGTGSFCLWAACVLRATHNGPIPQLEATCSEQRAQHLCGRPDPCQMCWAHCPRSTQLHASSSLSRKSQICVVALICVAFRLAAGPGTHTLLRHNRHSLLYRMPSVPQMGSNSLVHPLPRLKFSQTAWRYRRVILKMLNLFPIYQRSFALTERCTFCLS